MFQYAADYEATISIAWVPCAPNSADRSGMARQAATTSRKRPAAKTASIDVRSERAIALRSPKLDGLSAEQKVARLLADRAALVARIAKLESDLDAMKSAHTDVTNRVSWALDALKDVLGTKST